MFFNLVHNVGSYMQGRIAGDFLSSRKAAWAEKAEALLHAFGFSVGSCGLANVLTTEGWLSLLEQY